MKLVDIIETMFMNEEVIDTDNINDAAAVANALVEVYGNHIDYHKYCDYSVKMDGTGGVRFVCRVPYRYQSKFEKMFGETKVFGIKRAS